MGKEARANAATRTVRKIDPADYWQLRANLGDVDRATAAVFQAQATLNALIEIRTGLIQKAAGPDVDVNFVAHIDWNDPTFEITFVSNPKV